MLQVLRSTPRPLLLSRTFRTATHVNPSPELHLRQVFDNQKYFAKFTKKPLSSTILKSRSGLFKNNHLLAPSGLVAFSKRSLNVAESLVNEMLTEVHSEKGKLNYIKKLDRLSDVLCRVIDVAEFIRATHPSAQWVRAAQQTHEIMFEYMNQLNTNVELYSHLREILADYNITSKLSNEEIQVGNYLKQDFERSGIHMDPVTRDKFVQLNQEISVLGAYFNNDLSNVKSYWCELERHEFEEIPDESIKKQILDYQSQYGKKSVQKIYVVLAGDIPYQLLVKCPVELVRKKIWLALHSSPDEQIQVLNEILKKRAQLATMLGYSSFAEYLLEYKMARRPENVMTFLENVQKRLKSGVLDEMWALMGKEQERTENSEEKSFKSKKFDDESSKESTSTSVDPLSKIHPWDRDYLLHKTSNHTSLPPISDYLSVGTIMAGLSSLFKQLYNVEFIPEPTSPGETWDEHVRKLRVHDHLTKKDIGFFYVDFWSSKVLPSHFTIVCLRRLLQEENAKEMEQQVQLNDEKDYQLPVVSLVCNFAKGGTSIGRFAGIDSYQPTLLSLDEVDTVFHEVGHVMHSMLGRTELHNLLGTRGATDFVEFPSVLMELFSKDPRVLGNIAKHYSTNEKIDLDLLAQHRDHMVVLGDCEMFMQSKMAVLDQVLHGKKAAEDAMNGTGVDLTKLYHELEGKMQVFADKWSTWHGKFPHLFSYAAVYYSYLFDRMMAEQVWKGLFAKNPWSRAAGQQYREAVLNWGGIRDPWVCLGEALDRDELKKGGKKAMEELAKMD